MIPLNSECTRAPCGDLNIVGGMYGGNITQ